MPTIGSVKDLTKRSGKLTPMGDSNVELNQATMPYPLDEVWVGNNMKVCYFSHNFKIDAQVEEYFFEIGLINIPKGFQFVEYMENVNTPNWDNKKAPIEKTIYTHILMNINETKPEVDRLFHVCENDHPKNENGEGGKLQDKTTQGCSMTLLSRPIDKNYPFLLFYYFGKVYFSDKTYTNDEYQALPERGWFFIPLVLSERITIYYVVPEDNMGTHKTMLDNLYTNIPKYLIEQHGSYSIGITERLQLNDKLGIFVTRKLLDLP